MIGARVLVMDTWAGDPGPVFRQMFPDATFETVETPWAGEVPAEPHPHGAQVASCLLSQVPRGMRVTIGFLPVFNGQGYAVGLQDLRWVDLAHRWLTAGNGLRGMNRSIGAWDEDVPGRGAAFDQAFAREAEATVDLLADAGALLFAAAGNSDTVYLGSNRPELDEDLNWPQKLIADDPRVNVIGACDREGFPGWWSSDGDGVLCMYLGVNAPVLDPYEGRWIPAHGTSFATPFALGDWLAWCAAGNLFETGHDYKAYVQTRAVRMAGWPRNRRHPKAGWGGMLPAMRANAEFALDVVDGTLIPKGAAAAYHDLRRIEPRVDERFAPWWLLPRDDSGQKGVR